MKRLCICFNSQNVGAFSLTKNTAVKVTSLKSSHNDTVVELARYKLLVESVEDYAIFLMGVDGTILTWNKGAEKNKGYRAEEIIGKHFSTFYLPEDLEAHKPARELELAKRLGRVEDEDWRVRKDGSKFWANVVITALFDSDKKHVGFAKVTRDLTERKQNEDTLRHNNALLKRQQVELEALNTSKDEFISLASHQLRTPATVIKQLLGMLLEGFLGEVEPRHLEVIAHAYQANERQIRIVEDLLRVAQVDAGKIILRKKRTDLSKFLKEVVTEHSNLAEKKQQHINLTVEDYGSPSSMVDPDHFRMAISNLLDNASKYSYENCSIEVKLTAKSDETIVSIKDRGVGINSEDVALLFKKFSRIPNELSEKVGGSGLGLYWVQKIIKLHGGHIDVILQLGHGSTFKIYLPVEKVDA